MPLFPPLFGQPTVANFLCDRVCLCVLFFVCVLSLFVASFFPPISWAVKNGNGKGEKIDLKSLFSFATAPSPPEERGCGMKPFCVHFLAQKERQKKTTTTTTTPQTADGGTTAGGVMVAVVGKRENSRHITNLLLPWRNSFKAMNFGREGADGGEIGKVFPLFFSGLLSLPFQISTTKR